LIVLFTNRSRTLSWALAWAGVIGALVLRLDCGLSYVWHVLNDVHPHELEEHPVVVASAIDWLPVGDYANGTWLRNGGGG
jgi:hypothetical protein